MRRPPLIAALALATLVAGCSDGPLLENVGDISQRVVYGTSSSTLPGLTLEGEEDPLVLKPVDEITWFNAALADVEGGEAAVVTNRVWERGQGINRFVQAGPQEMALILPGIGFPSSVPPRTESVTSQIVFDVGSGLIDSITSAAFGLWAGTPYTVSRDQGQVAVLRVGQAGAFDSLPFGLDVQEVEDGLAFIWVEGDYRYELFCRTGVDERVCRHMAENLLPLTTIAARIPVPVTS